MTPAEMGAQWRPIDGTLSWSGTYADLLEARALMVICFSRSTAQDEDFPGHPFMVWNRLRLTEKLWRHWRLDLWAEMSSPRAGRLPWQAFARSAPPPSPLSIALWMSGPRPPFHQFNTEHPYCISSPIWPLAPQNADQAKYWSHWLAIPAADHLIATTPAPATGPDARDDEGEG